MANAKKIPVILGFTADTAQAKKQMQDLQSSLTSIINITNNSNKKLSITGDLNEAATAAASLKSHIDSALNPRTGTLDFSKFNRSIKQSGQTLQSYSATLLNMGPEGEKVFMQLAQAVASSEIPLRRANQLIDSLWESLKRTAKWQFSSSAIHGLVGSFQTAYNYSKDLNRSLNDIRIVTGQSVEQMSNFAKEANKAAKSLSASTLDYTEASLIYYQQGLSDEEVKKRTDATVKMANVTGENASNVSSYMTAIWNNFDNGSKSLEYYADVITALGAATASSSEEIAGGLEKFSSVAEQIGLSYEYATSALATVVSATRQSEDVVGTSFKTIFSRLQGVQLGETLEDGVTLNKYSEALAKVGIQITGTNGQLKDMDQILNEMGERWNSLSESQQTALAQTVGGVRQYTNLVALMKNWDKFQENLLVAYSSEGTLNEQAEIYAEGWEAARKRVQAALESIYQKLIDDEGFIALLNVGEDLLNLIGKMIDGLGGLQGVLSTIGLLATKVFNKQLVETISAVVYNLQGPKKAQEERQKYLSFATDLMYSKEPGREGEATPEQKSFSKILKLQNELIESASSLNEVENNTNILLLDRYRLLSNNLLESKKAAQEAEDSYKNSINQAHRDIAEAWADSGNKSMPDLNRMQKRYSEQWNNLQFLLNSQGNIDDNNWKKITELTGQEKYYQGRKKLTQEDRDAALWIAINKTTKNMSDLGVSDKTIAKLIKDYTLYNSLQAKTNGLISEEEALFNKLDERFDLQKRNKRQEKYNELLQKQNELRKEGKDLEGQDKIDFDALSPEFEGNTAKIDAFAESVVATAQAFTSLSSIASITKGIFATMSNDSMSFGEKLLTIASSVGMLLPIILQLVETYKKLTTLITGETIATGINTVATWLNTAAKKANKDATDSSKKSIKDRISEIKNGTATLWKSNEAIKNITSALGNLKDAVLFILKVFGKWIVVIGLIIAGITWFVHKWNTEWSPEAKLKKATEATELMSNAAKKANEEYNTLVTTINGFDDAYDKIQNMTKGTIEWQQAINSLNADIGNLIKKYPKLAKYTRYDENGIQILSKEGQELAKQLEYQNVVNAENARISAEGIERNARIEKTKSDLYKSGSPQLARYVEQLSALGVTDLNNISDKALEEAGLSQRMVKSLQKNYDNAQAYLNILNQDKAGDVADAKLLIGLNSDINSQIFGENSTIPEFMRSALLEEIAKAVNEKLDSGDYNGKAFLTEEEKQKIAENGNLLYENGKFYKKKEDGTKGDEADISDQLDRASAQKAVMQDINWKDYFDQAWENAAWMSKESVETMAEKYDANRAASIKAGFNEEDLKLLEQYQEHLQKIYDIDEKMAERVAIANMNFNKGLEDIIKNYEEYYNALTKGEKGSEDYAKALNAVKKDFSKILDLNLDDISDEFASSEENLNLMKKAAEGNIEALTQLRTNAALDIVADVKVNDEGLKSDLDFLKAQIALNEEFTFGTRLDNTKFYDALTELYNSGAMTIEETQKLLNSLGFEPEIDYEEVDLKTAKSYKGEVMVSDGKGGYKVATQEMFADEHQKFYIPKINGAKTTYRGAPKTIINSSNKSKIDKNAGSKKDAKNATDEIERYHVIKEIMEDINNELDKISKAKDRAFGGDKIALMDEEIAKTEELVEAQKAYLREIEAYYDKDKAAIAAYGAQFDANGVITNYDALIAAQVAKFNAARTDAAEEEFEKFKKVLEQYEETSDLVAEERQALIDQENELADLLLEKLEYEIELKIEISDDDLKYLDFLLKQIDDSAYEAADAIALLGEKTKSTLDKVNTYTEGINKLFQNHGFVGDITELLTKSSADLLEIADAYNFTEAEVETLREYRDGLMESTENLMDLQQEIRDKVIPAFEDLTSEMDKEIDKINHLSTMLEHYRNIIDIVGKDTLGISDELMESLSVAQVDNTINQLEASYSKLEGMRASRAEVEQQLEDARASGNEDLIKYWEETLAELDVQISEATENMASSLEEALKAVADAYDAAVQRSIERFEKAMSGTYGSLEALQDAYDKQQEVDERYLEDYEQIYELNKLNRDIANSIDDTDNIKGKQMLIELQKEINDLEDAGVKLSEYDVNFLRQKYELRLAEIALEEAQNAKSQVRMTRDSEGNWSYTYTADQQNIADAQQNYEDVLFETQQLSTEYINNLQGQIIDAQIAMNQELAQLRADDEEGRQRVLEHYQGQIDYLISQMQGALDNNKLIYEQDWQAYHDSTGYKISDQDEFLMNFENTNLAIMSGYDTLQDYQTAFTEASGLLYDELNEATDYWRDATERAMQAAGTSVETFAQDMNAAVNGPGGIIDQSNAAKDSVVNMGQTMATTFGNVLNAVDNFETNYGHLINGVIADNNVLIDSCNDIIRAWAQVDAAEKRQSFNTYNPTTGGTTDVSITDTSGGGGGLIPDNSSTEVTTKHGWRIVDSKGNIADSSVFADRATAKRYALHKNQQLGYDEYIAQKFNTGGYTGTWGTTAGKLAMLHEKELVLNKDDTVNFLKAINIVRELVGWLDTQAGLMSLPKLHASQLNYLSEGLEQNVIIDAHFPNATNKDEIKAAFHDLINRAAQYSNRKG